MRVALVLNDDFSMLHFFRGLIAALVARGLEVCVVTPDGPYVAALRALGASHAVVPMSRFVDPIADVRMCAALRRVFLRERPDVVCNMTIKPIVYGAIAARLAGVGRVVGMVEGLGYGFLEVGGFRARLVRAVVSVWYRVGCLLSDRVGFANPDDCEQFVRSRTLPARKAVAFRSMVGVDVATFAAAKIDGTVVERLRREFGIAADARVVGMVTRVTWSKGTKEFVEASVTAAGWPQRTVFLLVGPLEDYAPDAVPAAYLKSQESPSFVWIDSFRTDLREILMLADVVVLPSYYREGVPRVLLEALSLSKPIVTTDNVGCREVVDDGQNGFLIPVRDSVALAESVRRLIEDEELRRRFGRYSRQKAESEFSEGAVVSSLLTRLFSLAESTERGGAARDAANNLTREKDP